MGRHALRHRLSHLCFFGGHFQGKVKSVFPKSDATEKRKDLLQHHMEAAAALPHACMHYNNSGTVLKYLLRVSNPHGIVDTSSWQSSCLSTLDQSLLFDLHFSQPLSNHAGLVFHCAARSIWPPRIVFLGMAPGFLRFLSLSLFFFKNRVVLMFTMTLNAMQQPHCFNTWVPGL